MDYRKFYGELFAPLVDLIGPIDSDTIVAIIGFDMGGPLNFCTIGRQQGEACVTYVSCELAVRKEQCPSEFGRYELLASCDDEQWVRSIISEIGRMSLEVAFGDGHTLDIGPRVKTSEVIQGVVFERVCEGRIDRDSVGVLRVIVVTRSELEYAQKRGTSGLLQQLKVAGVYPNTRINRKSAL